MKTAVVAAQLAAMIAVDLADTWLASLWASDRGRWWILAVGVVTSTAIFVLVSMLLDVADIWWVTVAWATVTVTGGALIDRWVRDVEFPPDVIVGLVAALAIVGWLTWRMATLADRAAT